MPISHGRGAADTQADAQQHCASRLCTGRDDDHSSPAPPCLLVAPLAAAAALLAAPLTSPTTLEARFLTAGRFRRHDRSRGAAAPSEDEAKLKCAAPHACAFHATSANRSTPSLCASWSHLARLRLTRGCCAHRGCCARGCARRALLSCQQPIALVGAGGCRRRAAAAAVLLPVAQHAAAACCGLPVGGPTPQPVLQALHAGRREACRAEETAGFGCGGGSGGGWAGGRAGLRVVAFHSLQLPGYCRRCCRRACAAAAASSSGVGVCRPRLPQIFQDRNLHTLQQPRKALGRLVSCVLMNAQAHLAVPVPALASAAAIHVHISRVFETSHRLSGAAWRTPRCRPARLRQYVGPWRPRGGASCVPRRSGLPPSRDGWCVRCNGHHSAPTHCPCAQSRTWTPASLQLFHIGASNTVWSASGNLQEPADSGACCGTREAVRLHLSAGLDKTFELACSCGNCALAEQRQLPTKTATAKPLLPALTQLVVHCAYPRLGPATQAVLWRWCPLGSFLQLCILYTSSLYCVRVQVVWLKQDVALLSQASLWSKWHVLAGTDARLNKGYAATQLVVLSQR